MWKNLVGTVFLLRFHVKLKRHSVWFSDKKTVHSIREYNGSHFPCVWVHMKFPVSLFTMLCGITHKTCTIHNSGNNSPSSLIFFVSYIHFAHSILFALLFHIHFAAFHVIEFTKLASSNEVSLWIWYNLARAYVTYTHRIHIHRN